MRLAILGSGPGGYVAAVRAAQLGAQVTVIEEDLIGGTCLNWGCIPTKILASSAENFSRAKRLAEFGIEVSGTIALHYEKILERKERIVGLQARGIRNLFKAHRINFLEGRGQLVSPSEISVTLKDTSRDTVPADRIILATGSRPYELRDMPFDGMHILSTDDVFKLDAVPKSLAIIGAGVSGCEFACIFRQLGAEVTLIEKLPRALSSEDKDISGLFERELRKQGIKLLANTAVDSVELHGAGIRLLLAGGQEIRAEKALVSAGRSFNSSGIGAEDVGIARGPAGEILVSDTLETNVSGIYAVGDVIGHHLLAHVASAEGIVAAKNSTGGDERIDYSAVPSAIFTWPEIASAGLREQQADELGFKVRTGQFQFRTLAKSHIIGEIDGLVKIVSDEASDKVLGVHIIGPHASDLIHEGVLAISEGIRTRDLARMLHAHPTLAEVLQEAATNVSGEAIHSLPK